MSWLSHILKRMIVQDDPILFYLPGVLISRFSQIIICDIFHIALCSCMVKEHGCLDIFTQLGLLCSNSHKIVLCCSYIELQRLQFVSRCLFCKHCSNSHKIVLCCSYIELQRLRFVSRCLLCKHCSRDSSTALCVLAVAFAFAIRNCMLN